ncbi:MAG TPA: fused MFS/spermidine synthase [Chloroflexota bacterium]|nr:fused MFS/spermidine synthase [Chloroflexota bacterium]
MPKSYWWAYLVVFVASGCTLILEIVAGRIVAPVVGVSLYTWTSVIGVVLAGISLGNYTGGVVADRWGARRTLGIILSLGGVSSLAVLPLTRIMTDYQYPDGTSLVTKIVAMTAVIFFPPAFIISMTTPVVIKLSLKDLGQTGGVVGRIYAISTCGSIFSTFLTGFVLIAFFGTRTIVLWVGIVLLLLAVTFGGLLTGNKAGAAAATAVSAMLAVVVVAASFNLNAFESGCTKETNYYCIRVIPTQEDGRQIQQFILDHLIHSFSDVSDPTYLHYGYEKVYAEMMDYTAKPKPDFSTLELGGGGYTFPRYIEAVYPEAKDAVFEIDPGVTRAAYEYMGLSPNARVQTTNLDARVALQALPPDRKFDLILGDAFNDLSVPYHLTTQEFDRELRSRLTPTGFYLANIIDKMQGGRFIPSVVRTLKTVFPNVYVMSEFDSFSTPAQNTYVVAASMTALDEPRLRAAHGQGPSGASITQIMPQSDMQDWLQHADSVLLTDDYVPADNLLAPLFLERN